jgi:glutamyl-tRNA synthetase
MLLGWAHEDGKSEFFERQQMVELFTLERVNKAPASFDAKKLVAFQERYMQDLPVAERVGRTLPFLHRAGLVPDPAPADVLATLTQVMREAGPRLVVAGDVLSYADFFLPDDRLPYDDKAFDKHVRKPPGPDLLCKLRGLVADAEPFDAATLKQRVEDFATGEGVKPGPVSQTLRVAVTGKDVGFGTYETVAILGREHALARIDRALARQSS